MWKVFQEVRPIACGLARANGGTTATRLFSSATDANSDGESFLAYKKDPAGAFLRADVQKLLKSINRLELDKVFRKRAVKDNTIQYRFMTDAQLRQELVKSIQQAEQMLQMPPVVQAQDDSCRVISKDGALKSLATSKFVFTDITYGLKDSQRTIVVRHPDGTLQEAPYEMRKRLNQVYFPLTGRSIHTPPMFEDPHLQRLLEDGKYEFVLDRACIQYEPFEPQYHQLTARVYQHVNETKSFDALRSTRHFGPFVFFLSWHKLIDDLLLDMIKRDFLRNGVELIALYSTLHAVDGATEHAVVPDASEMPALFEADAEKSVEELEQDVQLIGTIERYVTEHGTKKVQLNLAIQAYREIVTDKLELARGIKRMHGES